MKSIEKTNFTRKDVSVAAIAIRQIENAARRFACNRNQLHVNAVLVFALVVRLSRFPNEIVLRAEWFLACGGAPRPGAAAPLLRRPRPVVVVSLPVELGQVAQALLLLERVDDQRRHAQAAARLPVFLPSDLIYHSNDQYFTFYLITK
jgi:hypothetical protein